MNFSTIGISSVYGINDAYTQDEILRQIEDPVLDPRIPIEQAVSNLPLDGGVVRLGSHTYYCNGTVPIARNNVSILGNSRTLITNTLSTGTLLNVTGDDFTISNVRLFDASTAYAIKISGERAKVTDVVFENVGGLVEVDGSDYFLMKCCRTVTANPATYLVELKASSFAIIMGNITIGGSIYADDPTSRSTFVGNVCPSGISYKGGTNSNAGNVGTVTVR